MSLSRTEALRNQLVNLFGTISEATGYRTSPKAVASVPLDPRTLTEFPYISVFVTRERLLPLTSNWEVIDSEVDVTVEGYFGGESQQDKDAANIAENLSEPLLHDIKRILGENLLTNVNDASNRWKVKREGMTIYYTYIAGVPRGTVGVTFTVQVKNQDRTFNAP
jgi:hypothetical protein